MRAISTSSCLASRIAPGKPDYMAYAHRQESRKCHPSRYNVLVMHQQFVGSEMTGFEKLPTH
jgi:hypothetical protein